MKYTKRMCRLAGAVLICGVLICGCSTNREETPTTIAAAPVTVPIPDNETQPSDLPWENGSKQPADYTWEEFEALSGELQSAFRNTMGTVEFEIWMEWAQKPPLPWDAPGAKQPEEYTWEEFEALSADYQIEFQNVLGWEAFEAWMDQAQTPQEEYPWDAPGAKQPEEYTWEEFEALSAEHQIAFQNVLGLEAFDAWLNQAQSQPGEYPWDTPGAKQPAEYTWEEFEALSGEYQIAFQNILGFEAFEAWLNEVNP